MPSNYDGSSASFPVHVVIPSDGDLRNAASVNAGFQPLADRTAYLKAHAIDGSGVGGSYGTGLLIFLTGSGFEFQSGAGIIFDGGSSLILNANISGSSGHFVSGYIGQIDTGAKLKVVGIIEVEAAGKIDVLGELEVENTAVLNVRSGGVLALNTGSEMVVEGAISMTGAGSIIYQYVAGADANTTYDYRSAIIDVPALTSARTYIITASGATIGQVMTVSIFSVASSNTLTLEHDDTSTIAVLQNTSGGKLSVDLVFDGSIWHPLRWTVKP